MKGVIVRTPGAAFELATDIEKPKPGVDQILVKSIATAINPVYAYPTLHARCGGFQVAVMLQADQGLS